MDTPLQIPNQIPIIVLSNCVLFPNALLPLHIFEERYQAMLQCTLDGPRIFGVAQRVESENPMLAVPDLSEIMGIGVVRACVGRFGGSSDLILQGLIRVRIVGEAQSEPFRIVEIEVVATEPGNAERTRELSILLREQSRHLADAGYQMPPQMVQYLQKIQDPEIIGDILAAAFVEDPVTRQDILETDNLETRLEIILAAMKLLQSF